MKCITFALYHQIPELFPFVTKYHTEVLKVSHASQQNGFLIIKTLKV